MLAGSLTNGAFVVTHALVPTQVGTSDSCTASNEEDLFDACEGRGVITLGWVHTHPRQTCFLSSVDLHTHCGYQARVGGGRGGRTTHCSAHVAPAPSLSHPLLRIFRTHPPLTVPSASPRACWRRQWRLCSRPRCVVVPACFACVVLHLSASRRGCTDPTGCAKQAPSLRF